MNFYGWITLLSIDGLYGLLWIRWTIMEWMDFSGVDNREIDILENSMMFVDLWELLDVYF